MNFTRYKTITAIMGCIVNMYLAGERSGYQKGFDFAENLCRDCIQYKIYGDVGNFQTESILVAACFLFFLLGVQLQRESLSRAIRLLFLLLALYIYLRWLELLISNSELSFWTNVENTVHVIDGVSFLLVVSLLIHELASLFKNRSERRNRV